MRTRARENAIIDIAIRNFVVSCMYDKCSWIDGGVKIRMMDRDPVEYAELMMLDRKMVEKIDKVLDLAAKQMEETGFGQLVLCISGRYDCGCNSLDYLRDYYDSMNDPENGEQYRIQEPSYKFDAIFIDPNHDDALMETGIVVPAEDIDEICVERLARGLSNHFNEERSRA